MRILIDIDDNLYTRLFDNGIEDYEIANDDLSEMATAIRKGTPLPLENKMTSHNFMPPHIEPDNCGNYVVMHQQL